MNMTFAKKVNTQTKSFLHASIITSVLLLLTGCGEVDKDDGEVKANIILPTDLVLKLYCPDAGIGTETCILDDPDNPYALTPIGDSNKFDLFNAAPSSKAKFYLWATAQAINPKGENQYYTAVSLHQLYNDGGEVSELAREQALRAYRSVLDNYFYAVTFFGPFIIDGEEVVIPEPVRMIVGQNMHSPVAPLSGLFSSNTNDNATLALQQFGQWGYTYDPDDSRDFTPNF